MPKPSPPPRKKFRISTTNGKNQNCVGISKEVENSVCSVELLDETTWVLIFAFLPNNYGPVLAGVCKQWRNIVLNNCPTLWTSFSMKLVKGRFPVSIVAAQELLKRAGVLSLRPLRNVISAISKFQALTATSVSVEMFPFFNSMRDSQAEKLLFKLLLCRFPNLSSVSIHGLSCVMQVNMFSETISQIPTLKEVRLFCTEEYRWQNDICYCPATCPQVLRCAVFVLHSSSAIATIRLLKSFPSLTSLEMHVSPAQQETTCLQQCIACTQP